MGFSGGARGKESACQYRGSKTHRFNHWVGKIPWSKKWQSAPVFLPGKPHGAWWAIVHGTTELGTTYKGENSIFFFLCLIYQPQWDIISHLSEWLSSKRTQIINVGEAVEKGDYLYTLGGNVNWCSIYGKQFGDFAEKDPVTCDLLCFLDT